MKAIRSDIFFLVAMIAMTQYACLSTNTQKQAERLIQEKNYQGAVDVYQAVINSKPTAPAARKAQLGIARLYIEKINSPQQGLQICRDLIAVAPDSEEAAKAYWHLGVYAFKTKDYPSAQQSFDAIVNKFPHLELSYNAQLMLAKSYEEAKDYQKATEIYDNVANRHPEGKRATQALTNKARIQRVHLKDKTAAMQTYQSVVKRYGKIEGTEESIGEAKGELRLMGASIPKPDDPSVTPYNREMERRAKRLERDRPRGGVERSRAMGSPIEFADSGFGVDPKGVMRPFKEMIGRRSRPGEGKIYHYNMMLNIAHMVFDFQNYRDAGAVYFRAIELAKRDNAPIEPLSYLRLAVCYRKLGMHQRASEMVTNAIKKDGRVLDAIITSATNQYVDGDYEKAIETYNSVVGFNRTKDPEIYWKIGLAYKKMGQPHKAVESFERTVAVKTDYIDALQSLAEVLHYQLKESERAGILQDIVDGKGDVYAGEKELGDICYKYRNYGWAKSKYEVAARIAQRQKKNVAEAERRMLDNQIVYARVHAAMAGYKGGMEDKAREIIDALAAEYPDHPLIPYGHGQLALLRGDTDTAIADFKASIEKDPSSAAAPIALGEYYVSQGNVDEAMALWKASLRANSRNRAVHRRVNQLKKQVAAQRTSDQKSE